MITTLLPYSRYIKAGAALAVVAVLFGAGWKARGWLADAAIAEVQRAHADAVATGASAAARLHAEYRATEQALQQANSEISDRLHYELMQTETEYAQIVADARTDLGRLRIESARCAANLSRATAATAAVSGNDDPAPREELSEQDGGLGIFDIARDADGVAARLRACQQRTTLIQEELNAYARQLRETP